MKPKPAVRPLDARTRARAINAAMRRAAGTKLYLRRARKTVAIEK